MNKTILQVPLNKDLKTQAEKEALSQGFSSLQEAVRLFLHKLAAKRLEATFEDTVTLSPQAIKRYNKMVDEIEQKKVETKTFTDTSELMEYLHE